MSIRVSHTDVGSHFAFGSNWKSYSRLIGSSQIEAAERGVLKSISSAELKGKSFLDIGCGSGLHSLAAARLGAASIVATDIDSDCVVTTRAVLADHADVAGVCPCEVREISVFDLDPAAHGHFDIVYSWGVLHHTGHMWQALTKAAAMVRPHGLLAIALYQRTRMDGFWKLEKRWCAHTTPRRQKMASDIFLALVKVYRAARGMPKFQSFLESYFQNRGMDYLHDMHDWLGGYPYETASADDVDQRLRALGFSPERVFATLKPRIGLFNSGCDEYVYRRRA